MTIANPEIFFCALEKKLSTDPSQFLCNTIESQNDNHKRALDDLWQSFARTVASEGTRVFGTRVCRDKIVPGWNDAVKQLYSASREAFLAWRRDNSPRHGTSADYMRRCRARFKLALRQCRAAEGEARALALARKFQGKSMHAFWSDIKTLNSNKPRVPTTIDGVSGTANVCNIWKSKFKGILNSIEDSASATELRLRLRNMERAPMLLTTPSEIASIVGGLAAGKSPGTDNVPGEVFKFATVNILTWVSNYFNALFSHGFVPTCITEVVISPLLKSALKDPCSSANYRPIAHATAVSKIFENIILNRLEAFIKSSDYQFGFKKGF